MSRWDTFSPTRRILAVARNVPATTRLLDALSLLRGDRRIEVSLTLTHSPAFHLGDRDLIDSIGARVIPWHEAVAEHFDLAITASGNGPLHQVRAPILLIPHGAGQHKLVDAADPDRGVHGIAPEQLIVDGRVVPASILLTGEEPLALLHRDCPEAVEYARVAGDLSFQQLNDALGDRERFRRDLGVHPHQRLITVSSTWGPASLLGRTPSLLDRVLADLPSDEYRVAAVLHPNIAARHSRYEIHAWYADALDAGLLLIPPTSGWQATLLATDCLIGDHGSVSFYAAALDIPILLAASGAGEIPPGGPSALLAEASPRFNVRESPRLQIERAIEKHDPGALPAITAGSLTSEVDAAKVYRDTMYELLELDPPIRPRTLPSPKVPAFEVRTVTTHVVYVEELAVDLVELRRFSASTVDYATDEDGPGRHLAVDVAEPDARFRQSASVLVDRSTATDPGEAATAILARYPGCLMAVVSAGPDTSTAVTRDGDTYALSANDGCDPVLVASAVHPYVFRGERPPERLVLRVAGRSWTVAVT